MLKNYLKIAYRNLAKHKFYSLISIAGLAIGIASSIIILRYVYYEMTYEGFNPNADDIYRIQRDIYEDDEFRTETATTQNGLAPVILNEMPEIAAATRLFREACLYRYEDTIISEQYVYWVDNDFIDIFNVHLMETTSNTPLRDTYSAIITESVARSLFGDEDPLGKTIYHNEGLPFTVTGIAEDYPANSHLEFDLLLSINTIGAVVGDQILTSMRTSFVNTYVMARPDTPHAVMDSNLSQIAEAHLAGIAQPNIRTELRVQPVGDIHLRSNLQNEHATNSNMSIIYILSFIALIILVMAWINFINISTATILERAKEVGVRKVVGTSRIQIIVQLVFESVLLNIIAFICALVLIEILNPFTRELLSQNIHLPFFEFPLFWVTVFVVYVTLGVVAALYPATLISSLKPLSVLKGTFKNTGRGKTTTKALVIFQYAAVIALMISTMAIYRQISYVQDQDLGFSADQVLAINTPRTLIATGLTEDQDRRIRYFERFKETLLNYSFVENVSVANVIPGMVTGGAFDLHAEGENLENIRVRGVSVELDYFNSLDMTIIAGQDFIRETTQAPVDSSITKIIINETAVNMLGFDYPRDAINAFLYVENNPSTRFQVQGVVNDHHQEYLKKSIEPILYIYGHGYEFGYLLVELNTDNMSGNLAEIGRVWSQIYPNDPFDYFFLNDYYDSQYKADRHLGQTTTLFSVLAIIISVLGLYGLISLSILQRTKEVGIRKIVGASVPQVVILLSREFLVLVLIANIIAWPIAWYAMNRWLESFTTRINLNPALFVLAGILALIIALAAVSWQTVRAAKANPVESLRYE